ncbi:hypothetical protein Rhow_005904 [Rhodococcus wratislaviensis]|uniref:Uncharacterized protein n=1 Tax=Rhodococcus wratislaviensis TaxID=44752 RepID=A0A402BZZ5_RHOWR|nr:hypothetical protein Rhow_005904 [Rhodococcus wratislaviensis]
MLLQHRGGVGVGHQSSERCACAPCGRVVQTTMVGGAESVQNN